MLDIDLLVSAVPAVAFASHTSKLFMAGGFTEMGSSTWARAALWAGFIGCASLAPLAAALG